MTILPVVVVYDPLPGQRLHQQLEADKEMHILDNSQTLVDLITPIIFMVLVWSCLLS